MRRIDIPMLEASAEFEQKSDYKECWFVPTIKWNEEIVWEGPRVKPKTKLWIPEERMIHDQDDAEFWAKKIAEDHLVNILRRLFNGPE